MQVVFATAVMGFAVYFIIKNISNNFTQIILGSFGGMLIYAGILLLFRNSYILDILKKIKTYIKNKVLKKI